MLSGGQRECPPANQREGTCVATAASGRHRRSRPGCGDQTPPWSAGASGHPLACFLIRWVGCLTPAPELPTGQSHLWRGPFPSRGSGSPCVKREVRPQGPGISKKGPGSQSPHLLQPEAYLLFVPCSNISLEERVLGDSAHTQTHTEGHGPQIRMQAATGRVPERRPGLRATVG